MANVLTQNPWLLDTASTSAVLSTLTLRIQRILWNNPTSGGTLILKDQTGKTMLSVEAATDDVQVYDVAICGGQAWNGLIAYQIPSGLVQLVYE